MLGGARVPKDDPRVDAYGEVDELNASLGEVRALLAGGGDQCKDIAEALVQIQRDLFALGARLADPTGVVAARMNKTAVQGSDVERLERLIDALEAELPPLTHFILAGGSMAGAALHVSRAVCRRAERRMVSLKPALEAVLIQYINRLSDLLFVMARSVNRRTGAAEMEW